MHTEADTTKEVRQRLPRALGPAGELIPFSEAAARAQQLLIDLTLRSGNNRVRALSEGRFCGQVSRLPGLAVAVMLVSDRCLR